MRLRCSRARTTTATTPEPAARAPADSPISVDGLTPAHLSHRRLLLPLSASQQPRPPETPSRLRPRIPLTRFPTHHPHQLTAVALPPSMASLNRPSRRPRQLPIKRQPMVASLRQAGSGRASGRQLPFPRSCRTSWPTFAPCAARLGMRRGEHQRPALLDCLSPADLRRPLTRRPLYRV